MTSLTMAQVLYRQVTGRCAVHRLLALCCAIIYAGVLATLPLDVFKDRGNYLIYAGNSWDILEGYWSQGALVSFVNEPLWLLINAGLSGFLDAEAVLRLIIFLPASIVAYLVLRHRPKDFAWLLLIILIPQVLKNHVIHLRQGMAVAIFLMGWFGISTWRFNLAILAAALVHASFFFIAMLWFSAQLALRLRLGPDLRGILFVGMGVGVGVGLGLVATMLGARQADEYQFAMTDISGLGFLFWFLVLMVMLSAGRDFARKHAFELGVVIFYLGTYFLVEVTARIFESALIPVLLSGLALNGWRRQAYLFMVCAYGVLQILLRSGQPWLGFGV